MQRENKDRVEHDVRRRTERYGEHSGFGKALTVDVRIEPKRHHHAQRTQQVNDDVRGGIRIGHIAGTEQVQQRTVKYDADDRQRCAACQQHECRIDHDALCALAVALAARHRAERCAAQPEQIGKRRDECHERKAQADARQRQRALARYLADVNTVYDIIQ